MVLAPTTKAPPAPGVLSRSLDIIWKPLPKQALAIACPADIVLFGGAVGGGKTDCLIGKWVAHAMQYGVWAAGLIVRRSMPELREVMKRCTRLFPKLGAVWRGQAKTWTFPNGAVLLLGYLENEADAERYWGQEFTFIGVDEAGYFPDSEAIDKLASRLRSVAPEHIAVKCQLYLTANPGGSGHAWLKAKFIEGKLPCVPWIDSVTGLSHVYIPSYLTDNPWLMRDKSYVGRIKGSGPSWFVQAILRGDWSVSVNGKVFLREWFADNRYDKEPTMGEVLQVIQSWDMANKDGEKNDRSACTTWAITEQGVYLVHSWAGRMSFPDQVQKMKDLAARKFCGHTPALVLIEDKGNGTALIQQLKRSTTLRIVAVDPGRASKEARAIAQSLQFEGTPRKVLFPQTAEWLDELVEEMCAFPKVAHDDLVDSVVQAIAYIFKRFPGLTGVKHALGISHVAKAVAPKVKPREMATTAAEYEAHDDYEDESEPRGF
jgi:predicted phage terminase large subunit-like protein